jgi:thioredoxin-dependent peroxiredoxin
VAVLGVSPDEPAKNKAFAAKFKVPYPLLSDPERTVMTSYGAYGKKMMYGKDVIGVIRSSVWIGPDGVVKKHWRKVADASKHPAQVLELMAARR